jgi:hypothetical protein
MGETSEGSTHATRDLCAKETGDDEVMRVSDIGFSHQYRKHAVRGVQLAYSIALAP